VAEYPSAPDFATPGSDQSGMIPNGWWSYTRPDGTLNVCVADGSAILRRARNALGLSPTPVWDADLQSALITRVQLFANAQPSAGWQPFLNELQNGLTSQSVTPNAMKFAVWMGYYQPNGLRLDAINLDSNAVLPPWGVTLQDGPAGDAMACYDPNRDQSIYELTPQTWSQAQTDSSLGIRLHPGEQAPSPVAPIPPPGPSGLPTWALVVIGAIALVALVTTQNVKYEKRERTSVVPPVPRSRRAV